MTFPNHQPSQAARRSLWNSLTLVMLGAVPGFCASQIDFSHVTAQERRPKPPVAFKSGGERAAETLEKISTQIAKLDARLANIESAVTDSKPKRP